MSEDVQDDDGLDVNHRSGLGCLTLMATHTGVSHDPKVLWVRVMFWKKFVDEYYEVVRDNLDVEVKNVQDDMDVGPRW